jgi:outer membrane protein TolC
MTKLFTGLLLCAGLFTTAQEPLSLSDAIRIGLERNYDIRIEDKNIETAENNNEWGSVNRLPSITLTASSNNSLRNQESDNQFFGGTLFPGFQLNDQRAYTLQPGATVNWTIFQGNRAIISKRRLEQLEAESYRNADIVVANTLQAIISAYYLAVLEKQRLEEFNKQLALSSDKYDYIKTKQELGSAVTTDVLLEENNYLTDSANYLSQQLALNNAFRNLNVILAEPDMDRKYTLTDSLVVDEVEYSLEELQSAAFSDNVDLERIFLSQAVLELTTRQSRADRFPTLSLSAGYNFNRNTADLTSAEYSGPDPNFQTPPEPLVSKTGTYFANFTLSFTLFDGQRINRAIRNAMVQEDIGNLRVEQLEQSVSKDLLDAYDQYRIRKQLFEINKRKRQAAETNLRNSEEKFRNGSINSFDYRDVQNNYLSAAIQELQSIYNLIDSKITLMRLTGGLINRYGGIEALR